jgi:hypothetical protein
MASSPAADIRRLAQQLIAHDLADTLQLLAQRAHGIVVAIGEPADLRPVVLLVAGQQQRTAVAENIERAAEGNQAQAMPSKIEVADDFRAQQAQDVGGDGIAVARMEFLGHRGAADDRATLQHQRAQAGLAEIGGRRQAVMPGADDDGVVGWVCR